MKTPTKKMAALFEKSGKDKEPKGMKESSKGEKSLDKKQSGKGKGGKSGKGC